MRDRYKPTLSRDELTDLAARIMAGEGETEEEQDRLVELFEENLLMPRAADLIF